MENFNTVTFVMDHGEEALIERLRDFDLESLKKLFRYNCIDRITNLRKKSLTSDELIAKIVEASSRRAHRGDAFRNL